MSMIFQTPSIVSRWILRLTVIVALLATSQAHAQQVDIKISTKSGLQHRVKVQYEHQGDVIIEKAGEAGEQPRRKLLPMNAVAKLDYFQRLTGNAKDPQAIRFFDSSQGDFEIEKGKTAASLSPNNRLVVTRLRSIPGQRLQMASVLSTLEQAEYLLIKNPADPLTFARLLDKPDVKIGKKWKVDDEALADFLNVDRILFSDARLLLKNVVQQKARIYMVGKVDAAIDDVATAIKVSAIFDVDLTSQIVTDVRVNIDQNREPGQIAPGFEGKSKVDMQIAIDSSCPHLETAALKRYTKSRRIKQRLMWKSTKGKFALQYDPRWRVITSEDEVAVMRFVSDGDLLAQCDIVQLPARPADNPLSLEAYKAEVRKIISADQSAKIASASESKIAAGGKALKVVVKGVEAGVPVQWNYYHVSAEDGRRLTFVFTLEQEVAGVFQPSDQRMVSGVKFLPLSEKVAAQKSSTAKKATQR